MPEDRLTISSTARTHPDEVARHTFGTARRGFDPAEVRSFLEHVARELMAAADREQELRRAVAEAEHRAAHPVLDDATLTAALGQETARVLQSAHDAAAELTARAEHDAAQLLTQANEEADELQQRTEQAAGERTAQSEAAVAEMRRRAQEEAASKLEVARLEAEALLTQTRSECRSMVQEAQELRARVLSDLTRRRRVLHSQIEQLRAGRERLAETIGDVRTAVDHITDELFRAEDEARLAAEEAGRQAASGELAELATNGDGIPEDASDTTTDGVVEGLERRQSVDELFARLRAETGASGRTDDATVARQAHNAQPDTADAGPAPAGPAGEPSGRTAAASAGVVSATGTGRVGTVGSAGSAGDDAQGRGTDAPAPGSGAEEPRPGAEEPSSEDEDDPLVVQRDEILVPLVTALARRLKRALQDDQNDILDRLRAKGGWGPNVLLPADEHAQRYVRASIDQLVEVARAGATFGGGKPDDAPGVDEIATALANDIVGPLRRRLDGEGQATEVGDEAALVELVGAAFREWKGTRVERLAGDQAVFAFARAVLAAVPDGTALRWIVDDDGVECPDCDDNALAGPVPAGEEYPTGHRHPPAHAGCRCLLAPASA
ncbi:MAG: DivIVA domain-containing protein [Acidimicrobiales bacterium]